MPEPEIDDTNLTDVNGAPSSMDEDGEQDTAETNVNEAPDEGGSVEEEDHSCSVQKLVTGVTVVDGGEQTHITATVHGPSGFVVKRTVRPGLITAKKLAAAIAEMDSW